MNLTIISVENRVFEIPTKAWATFVTLLPKFKVNYWLSQYQLSRCKLDEIGLEKCVVKGTSEAITLNLKGKLDRERSLQIQKALLVALSCYNNVEINIKEVSLIDTSGLAILINLLRKAKLLNKSFRLTGVDAHLTKIFALNRVDAVFNLGR